jgi:hypothetical protein
VVVGEARELHAVVVLAEYLSSCSVAALYISADDLLVRSHQHCCSSQSRADKQRWELLRWP